MLILNMLVALFLLTTSTTTRSPTKKPTAPTSSPITHAPTTTCESSNVECYNAILYPQIGSITSETINIRSMIDTSNKPANYYLTWNIVENRCYSPSLTLNNKKNEYSFGGYLYVYHNTTQQYECPIADPNYSCVVSICLNNVAILSIPMIDKNKAFVIRLETVNEPPSYHDCSPGYTLYADVTLQCNSVPTPSPTFSPTTPSTSPTLPPTASPTPTLAPIISPSKSPTTATINPTTQPTFEFTCSYKNYCSNKQCNALALDLTVQSHNNVLYHNVSSDTSTFANVIKNNVVDYCSEHKKQVEDRITLNATNVAQNCSNYSFQITYDVVGCIEHICSMYTYLDSLEFVAVLSRDINNYYANTETKVNCKVSVLPTPYSIHSIITKFSIHNPISITLISFFAFVWLILLAGFFHSTYPNIFAVIGFTMIDNFKINRVVLFLFSTFAICNHVNSSYSYFYAYSIYQTDVIFLIAGCLSLLIIIIKVILNGMMVKLIENDVKNDRNYNYIGIWLESYKSKLMWLILISGSFNSSLWMVNSNLFGFRVFSMHLSYKQLIQYRLHGYNLKFVFLTLSLLIISISILMHIHINKYKQNTIEWLTIISILCCSFNLIQKLLMKCSSNNNENNYQETRMDIKINVDKRDKNIIQKQKYLRSNMKKIVSEILEINERNLNIVKSQNTENGICISFVIYHKTYADNKNTELEKTLLENDNFNDDGYEGTVNVNTKMNETWYIEKKTAAEWRINTK